MRGRFYLPCQPPLFVAFAYPAPRFPTGSARVLRGIRTTAAEALRAGGALDPLAHEPHARGRRRLAEHGGAELGGLANDPLPLRLKAAGGDEQRCACPRRPAD